LNLPKRIRQALGLEPGSEPPTLTLVATKAFKEAPTTAIHRQGGEQRGEGLIGQLGRSALAVLMPVIVCCGAAILFYGAIAAMIFGAMGSGGFSGAPSFPSPVR
jgi:hypothetical protein